MTEDKDTLSSEERALFEKYVYWTKDEVDCYNKGVSDAISVVNRWIISPLEDWNDLIKQFEALKKKL